MPDEDDIFARFAALRSPPSHAPESPTAAAAAAAKNADVDDERLARIAGGDLGGEDVGDDEVEKLMAQLRDSRAPDEGYGAGGGTRGTATGTGINDDPNVRDLQTYARANASGEGALHDEAAAALAAAMGTDMDRDRAGAAGRGQAGSTEHYDVSGFSSNLPEPEESEEDIISRALAEASLERHNYESFTPPEGTSWPPKGNMRLPPPPTVPVINAAVAPTTSTAPGTGADPFSDLPGLPSLPALPALPSLPSLPTFESDDADVDPDSKARMDALMGLKGPSIFPNTPSKAPTKKDDALGPPPRAPGQGWNIPGYVDARDDDLDSWCCE